MKGLGIRLEKIEFTLAAAGTVLTTLDVPWTGSLEEVRVPNAGTTWAPGGTADVTLTRADDGGTLLAVTNLVAPAVYHPRPLVNTTAGADGTVTSARGPAVNGAVVLNVTSGKIDAAGTDGTIYAYIQQ